MYCLSITVNVDKYGAVLPMIVIAPAKKHHLYNTDLLVALGQAKSIIYYIVGYGYNNGEQGCFLLYTWYRQVKTVYKHKLEFIHLAIKTCDELFKVFLCNAYLHENQVLIE